MELLDVVPADSIVLRLYSLPSAASTVGSLFAWIVAALAAAVGFWCIRAVGSSSKPSGGGVPSALVDDEQHPRPLLSPAIDEPRPARAEPASASEPSTPSKVRFTAYYGGTGAHGDDGVVDGVKKCADRDEDDDGVYVDDENETSLLRRTASMRKSTAPLTAASWEEKELAVRRRGDLGWYRHLDMAALDSSVVRLWDGEMTAAVASPRARRRRAGLKLHLSL